MKLLAIEKEITEVNWKKEDEVLISEAYRVHGLFQEGIIRDIYMNEFQNAIIILECSSKDAAMEILGTLPLVQAGLISFEVMELHPYTGFNRIIYKPNE